ncbi:MAG: L-2-hydroxyglutarate oxidase [Planctomycetota bacterium]
MSIINDTAAPATPSNAATDATLYDITVVGGGIVGLATAYTLSQRHPDRRVVVLEKESVVAKHQTGHNSGVIHSGIYYKPGSLKATNCRRGKMLMEQFCADQGIAYDTCGKVIVAIDEADLGPMEMILGRGKENGVNCTKIGVERLKELEPNCAGVAAIHVPESGIVYYTEVCQRLAQLVEEAGGSIMTGAGVQDIVRDGDTLVCETGRGEVRSRYLVNCAGLHSDRVTKLTGQKPPVKIVPFRGEYFELKPHARSLVKNLIYPTPDPAFPFLGVHFTRMIHADEHGHHVECGPNAVLAYKREGYSKLGLSPRDLAETLTYPAFWKMSLKYWKTGVGEMWRSVSKAAFVKALQRLLPAITADDLEPAPAGVRAQALAPDGKLLDDFALAEGDRVVNVLNAPSPAATASLAIAEHIADRLATQF